MSRMQGRALALLCLALAAVASPLVAQESPFLVKYGKWIGFAAALGMGLKSADAHADANHAFDRLRAYCQVDRTRCQTGPNGRYLDPVSERYYQSSLDHDRRARLWLLGGEVTFLGATTMFVWELTRPKKPPENIPFEPEFRVLSDRTEVGFRIPF